MAHHKGTGLWSVTTANELGVPVTLMQGALYARQCSTLKEQRSTFFDLYNIKYVKTYISKKTLKRAYDASRIVNLHQGFEFLQTASEKWNWNLSLEQIAQLWTAGCIIKSKLMEQVGSVLMESNSLLTHPLVVKQMQQNTKDLRKLMVSSIEAGVALPCFSAAWTFFQSIVQQKTTANMIQAQRDFFGAHGYERTDAPKGVLHHTKWTKGNST